MTRKKRVILAVSGFLVFVVFLLKEIFYPEKSSSWHTIAMYLYTVGIIVMAMYFLLALKDGKDN